MNRVLIILLFSIGVFISGNSRFIQVNQEFPTKLIDQKGRDFIIKGISFGNSVWMNPKDSSLIDHHTKEDYIKVKELGFNSVRFYINYGLFEDDNRPYTYKESGFKWLDDNIRWAKEAGVLLLLNMHFPPGGYQSIGDGDALWTDNQKQKRLAKLWREIASRYRDEETILGYGIVNEPIPVNGISQWGELAKKIIKEIRREDKYHLIFIESALYSKSGVTQDDENNLLFPRGLKDSGPRNNLVYEFHFYSPIEFTHQNASWLPKFKGDFTQYPDKNRIITDKINWIWFSETGKWFSGSSNWKEISNDIVFIDNKDYRIGKAVVQTAYLGDSTLFFDDLKVEEFDKEGNFLRTIFINSVDRESHWSFWSKSGQGYRGISANKGSSNKRSLLVKNTNSDANFSSRDSFELKQGYGYRVSGRLKGEIPSKAKVRLRIDYYQYSGEVYRWDREFLRKRLEKYQKFSLANKVPIYLGEFGTIRDSFDNGGYIWLEDMLNIIKELEINYNYHTYNEYSFGLYFQGEENRELAEIFKKSN